MIAAVSSRPRPRQLVRAAVRAAALTAIVAAVGAAGAASASAAGAAASPSTDWALPATGTWDAEAGLFAAPATASRLPDAAERDGLASRAADEPAAPVDRWLLADALLERAAKHWLGTRGAYGGTGNLSVRANALYLELHAIAAAENHVGPARDDARARELIRFLTTAPVLVRRTSIKRAKATFPHAPAWQAVYTRQSSKASLHPSADAIVARALLGAWNARSQLGLTADEQHGIRRAVGLVARGRFYRDGRRAANQVNWNADVLVADAVINGRGASLARYRRELVWFAQHMRQKVRKGGSTNVTAGGALRYDPSLPPSAPIHIQGSGEYENLVHGALAYYRQALRAGMAPLSPAVRQRLARWSQQVVLGTWTQAGYLNWDTALGSKRRHLRQYWGFALDALLRTAGPGGFVDSPQQRAFVRLVARQGVELFARTAWDGEGALPGPTSFGAPNGFREGTGTEVMAPLRFALIALQIDPLLQGVTEADPGLVVADDRSIGRLAVSSRRYSLGIVRAGPGLEGGLEPTRLFDGRQRPLTVLGADGLVGPAPDVRLLRQGKVLAATQPGHTHALPARFVGVRPGLRDRTAARAAVGASGVTSGGPDRVSVLHRFTQYRVETRYVVRRKLATKVVLRLPVWGDQAQLSLLAGTTGVRGGWRATGQPVELQATTSAGAAMTVRYTGIPAGAQIRVVPSSRDGRAPAGTRTVVITASAAKVRTVRREIAVAPADG